jgi:hypothetical protein
VRVTVQADFKEQFRALERLQRDVQQQVLVRSVNRTADIAKTAMSREIREEFAIGASYVRERLRIKRASFKNSSLVIEAKLMGSSPEHPKRAANVIAFGARETAGGLSVKIKRKEARKVIAGAFIGNKSRTAFTRVPGTRMDSRSRYRGVHAEKIKPVTTIDVPQMFNTRRVLDRVARTIRQRFPAVFERELKFALLKFNR